MFTASKNDMARTLTQMVDEAKPLCQYDQAAARRQVAQWIRQDRRFDRIGMSATEIAEEAFECRRSGKQMRLGPKPIELDRMPPTFIG